MIGVRVPMGTRKPTTYLNDNSSLKIFNPIYFNQSPFLNNIPPHSYEKDESRNHKTNIMDGTNI